MGDKRNCVAVFAIGTKTNLFCSSFLEKYIGKETAQRKLKKVRKFKKGLCKIKRKL